MRHALMGRRDRRERPHDEPSRPSFGRTGLGLVSIGLPHRHVRAAVDVRAGLPVSCKTSPTSTARSPRLLIVALGQLIVALIGGIDISVGSVVSLTSVLIVPLDPGRWPCRPR